MKTEMKWILIVILANSLILPQAFAEKPEWAGKANKPEWAGSEAGRAGEERERAVDRAKGARVKGEAMKEKAGKDIPPGIAKLKEKNPEGSSKGEKEGWEGRKQPPGVFERFKNFFTGGSDEG